MRHFAITLIRVRRAAPLLCDGIGQEKANHFNLRRVFNEMRAKLVKI
jgi:hypothetical protein